MTPIRFREIAAGFEQLRVAVVGDFCLDRYLEIDPALSEESIETGLPVHNVTRVRAQPGAAGTVLNNLVALGAGQIDLIGFNGDDGEGFELRRALLELPGVNLDHFRCTPDRRTFTYCKPLVLDRDGIPRELNRLDSKNWTPTPAGLVGQLIESVELLAPAVSAIVVMDQVDVAETGVVTKDVLGALARLPQAIPVIADSRRGLLEYPPVIFKMNAAELEALTGQAELKDTGQVEEAALELAMRNQRAVFVTMAERGMVGALPTGETAKVAAFPTSGPIDVVGAGDAVTANLAASLPCGASLQEALEIAAAAASVVIQQLGTTGSASITQIVDVLQRARRGS